MVKVWLTELQVGLILRALKRLKDASIEEAQWNELTDEIDRLRDEIFHAGEDEE